MYPFTTRRRKSLFQSRRLNIDRLENREVPTVWTVTDLTDSGGPGSLRYELGQAIGSAQQLSGQSVVFAPGLSGTIALTGGPLNGNTGFGIAIVGSGADKLTISGSNLGRVFELNGDFSISDLRITAGNATGDGGAISVSNTSNVYLRRDVISGNSASGAGGAIASTGGNLFLDQCTISNNTAGSNGGAIAITGGLFGIGNTGSVIANNSTFSGNQAPSGSGGAVFAARSGNYGPNCVILRNDTIAGNMAQQGGAVAMVEANSPLSIYNSTIVRNTTTVPGSCGGLLFDHGNYGNTAVWDIESSIIAENGTAGQTNQDISAVGTVRLNYSAVGDPTGFTPTGGHNIFSADLKLGMLADNGGPTLTIAPQQSSPVQGVGYNPLGFQYDQRGSGYPRQIGSRPDIGAVTLPPFTPVSVAELTDVVYAGPSIYDFQVNYSSVPGIIAATFGNSNIRVTGPNGFNQLVQFLYADVNSSGPSRTATYRIFPPGGTWDAADAGTYTVSMEPNQVYNLNNVFVPPGLLDTFRCRIGQTYVVTNTGAQIPGSFDYEVNAASSDPSNNVVTFDPSFFSTPRNIILTYGAGATDDVSVVGPGAGLLTLTPTGSFWGFSAGSGNIPRVTLSDLTFSSTASAPAIRADAPVHLTLDHVAFQNLSGLAVSLSSPVSSLTTRNCTWTDNNTFPTDGGTPGFAGIALSTGAALVMDNTRWTNTSGAIINFVSGGPGIPQPAAPVGQLLIENSTFANSGGSGAMWGLRVYGAAPAGGLTIRNITFFQNGSANTVYGPAAFIGFQGTAEIQNCTFTKNMIGPYSSGGAIEETGPYGSILIQSSIVSGNSAAGAPGVNDIFAQGRVLLDHSAIGSGAGFTATDLGGNIPYGTDLKLAPLADNGGPTLTVRPANDSPLVNNGINPADLFWDQRGQLYLRVVGIKADIGAIEATDALAQPPRVLSVVINGGAVQRSRVTSVAITFDSPVGTTVDSFQLRRQSDGQLADASQSTNGNIVTLSFNGALSQFGSLADGRYTLCIVGNKTLGVNGQYLDGNGDGIPGDDYVMASAGSAGIFRLFGDSNGDGTVTSADFLAFRSAFGGNTSMFDFDGNGAVGTSDFLAFRSRFGASI